MTVGKMDSGIGGSTGSNPPQSAGGVGSFATLPKFKSGQGIGHLVESLAKAIEYGDEMQAKTIVSALARQNIPLKINTGDLKDLSGPQQEISIEIHIEDREASGGFISMKLKPSTTISDLKYYVLTNYHFPMEVQKWIVGKKIAKDEESLESLGVKSDGSSIFLYLMKNESAGLTRDMFATMLAEAAIAGNQGMEELFTSVPTPQSGDQSLHLAAPVAAVQPQPRNAAGQANPPATPAAQARPTPPTALSTPTPIGGATAAPQRAPPATTPSNQSTMGWQCPRCTYLNAPTRPGCEMCTEPRPEDYRPPANSATSPEERDRLWREEATEEQARQAEQLERQANLAQMLETADLDLVPNTESFDCLICYDHVAPREGVVIRECLHQFCRDCLAGLVETSEEPSIKCPFQNDTYTCEATLLDREIKALVSDSVFQQYLRRQLTTAESQDPHSYHCKTADCVGWCIYDDDENFFTCPVCRARNCLTCKAVHQGMTCAEYQAELRIKAENDVSARQTNQMLEAMLNEGTAMKCPSCLIVLQKKEGCDWVKCTMCKTEICWVTRGPRWGPEGQGDTSGGCRCRVAGKKCHPDCNNCH